MSPSGLTFMEAFQISSVQVILPSKELRQIVLGIMSISMGYNCYCNRKPVVSQTTEAPAAQARKSSSRCDATAVRNRRCKREFYSFAARAELKRWQGLLLSLDDAAKIEIEKRARRMASERGRELSSTASDAGFTERCNRLLGAEDKLDKQTAREIGACLRYDRCRDYVKCFMARAGHMVGYRTKERTPAFSCQSYCEKYRSCFWSILAFKRRLPPSTLARLRSFSSSMLKRIQNSITQQCMTKCTTISSPLEISKLSICLLSKDCNTFAACAL